MNKDLLNLILSALLILSIGLLSGYALGFHRAKVNSFPAIRMVDDVNPKVATIEVLGVKNGELKGKLSGREARILISDQKALELQPGSEFGVPLSDACRTVSQKPSIPEGMNYVASRQGKYFYSVLNEKSWSMAEKNRLFFKTAEEAKKAGFSPVP
jgi:hypothetical protein